MDNLNTIQTLAPAGGVQGTAVRKNAAFGVAGERGRTEGTANRRPHVV
jgi:hypothetical protein